MFGDIVEGFFESIGWGIGGATIAAVVILGGRRAKPLAKDVVKGYLTASNKVREMTAEASESFQDIYAEAKHEFEARNAEETASTTTPHHHESESY